jgi:pimeloyl-ACP methyl ester carboxylesterase
METPAIQFETSGAGKPLVLIHGLGGSARSWDRIIGHLQDHRELVVLDLPGHGRSPASQQDTTFSGLVHSVEAFLRTQDLNDADIVGSSLGGRIVLELARRGAVASAIALDPGGFWRGWERHYVFASLMGTIKLIRGLGSLRHSLAKPSIRPISFRQLSYNPSHLPEDFVAGEIQSCHEAPNFEAIVRDLTSIAPQQGPAAGYVRSMAIGWGRQDRLCFPRQARRAQAAFPGASLHWFDRCGHFPMWDQPLETADFILRTLHDE